MITFGSITKIEINANVSVDREAVTAELSQVFPNAEILFDVEYTGWAHNKPVPVAAWSGKWYQADLASPVYQLINQVIEANAK